MNILSKKKRLLMHRSLIIVATLIASVGFAGVPTPKAHAFPSCPSSQYCLVENLNSGKCMQTENAGTFNGAKIEQWQCPPPATPAQFAWYLQDMGGGYYRVRHVVSGRCLDVSGGSTANGAPMLLWDCGTQANQQFQLYTPTGGAPYYLRPKHIQGWPKCVDVPNASTNNGVDLIQWTCTYGQNQAWYFRD